MSEPGSDDSYNDQADLSYFSGHGSSGTLHFSNTYGYNALYASQTRWGNQDLDIIAMDACQVLNASGRSTFISTDVNDGVHWLMGFQTNAWDVSTTADLYGYYLAQGYYVDSAWIVAAQAGHDSSFTAATVHFRSSACNTWWDTATTVSCDPTSGSWGVSNTYTL